MVDNEAIAMMMRLEGIVMDTCYTGKTFAGLVRRARAGCYKPEDNVLFCGVILPWTGI